MRNLRRMNPTCGLYHAYCERLPDGITAFDEK
jgi:hypothetical protein